MAMGQCMRRELNSVVVPTWYCNRTTAAAFSGCLLKLPTALPFTRADLTEHKSHLPLPPYERTFTCWCCHLYTVHLHCRSDQGVTLRLGE